MIFACFFTFFVIFSGFFGKTCAFFAQMAVFLVFFLIFWFFFEKLGAFGGKVVQNLCRFWGCLKWLFASCYPLNI